MIDVQTTKAINKRILSIILGSSIWSWNNISIRKHAVRNYLLNIQTNIVM